ncbi:hypothetical protein ACIBI9_22555 [Nonomuraea sp. NPDC050451]|uniref:hypothetical protein n=1 Tax=Nonomuraea sp. NPDC050451 TaxID=3364364 RepID=UPI0037AB6604
MSYLLGTNVVSEMTKRTKDDSVQAWLDTITGPSLYLSVMVFGEIRKGIELLRRRDVVQAHGCTLVTRNVKDFVGLDVETINPFDWPTA